MSLNDTQRKNTINELKTNFELAGLTAQQAADDLKISKTKFKKIMKLDQQSLEDPWILSHYLIKKVLENHQSPVPFSVLRGDYHRYIFLDTDAIDAGQMSAGDD